MEKEVNCSKLIQWYPGHMTKTKRLIEENIKLVDIVIELLDARAPYSTKNPDIDKLAAHKKRIIILNKADLVPKSVVEDWIKWYGKQNIIVQPVVSTSGKGIKEVIQFAEQLLKERIEKDKARGRIYRPIRAMVVGIPNVGKSTFINTLVGKGITKTGDKPGVTRGKQWIKIKKGFELLDMPGILWPKFEDQEVARHLAYIGSINDQILDQREMAIGLLTHCLQRNKSHLESCYNLTLPNEGYEAFKMIGTKRGLLKSGGELDELRTAQILLNEFRAGKWGQISLEFPK